MIIQNCLLIEKQLLQVLHMTQNIGPVTTVDSV